MKTLVAVLFFAAASAQAASAPYLGSTGFSYPGFKAVAAAKAEGVPVVAGEPRDLVTAVHLLPRCGTDKLIGFADTPEQYQEAVALWTRVLASAGLSAGRPTFEHGIYTLPYDAPQGLVLREFMADPKQFKPKDPADLLANREMTVAAMEKAGLKPVAAWREELEGMLPTWSVYYLAKKEARTEDEKLVRILHYGEDIDDDALAGLPLQVVQKPRDWMRVYIGPELGMVSLIGRTQDELDVKVAKRQGLLVEMGKKMIAVRVHPIAPESLPEYRWQANLYFWQ
ncbi:MAG: hypothetical protein WC969_01165 [Elusimicrobiota bacterium]|jgi:hypothetical protein